jgi:tRNA U38,U39,U40 pseudouridine synthase TruA
VELSNGLIGRYDASWYARTPLCRSYNKWQTKHQNFYHSHRCSVTKHPETQSTSLFSTSVPTTSSGAATTKSKTSECQFCGEKFTSRNSLFRHIKQCSHGPQESASSKRSQASLETGSTASKRHTFGFSFAYSCNESNGTEPEAQIAGRQIQHALGQVLGVENGGNETHNEFQIFSCTQATVANQRHRSLAQEAGCAAANDIMTISFASRMARLMNIDDGNKEQKRLQNLVKDMNSVLDGGTEVINTRVSEILPLDSSTFHAENGCTQYIYHYMMPLKWLQDGAELEQWWLDSENNKQENSATITQHPGTFQSKPPSDSLKKLRSVLKSTESITVPNRRVRRRLENEGGFAKDRQIEKVAVRRLGTTSNKERRAWHNFADPALQGDASPNQEPVWRVLDRSRISEITKNPFNDEVVAVLEFRGDAFLPQQIRRIVGTAVGVTNGWLPSDTFDIATCPENAISTILAPFGRLYLRAERFHFNEDSDSFFVEEFDNESRNEPAKTIKWLRQQIFSQSSCEGTISNENKWIYEVKKKVAPEICNQILTIDECHRGSKECEVLDPAPKEYSKVLCLLREISVSNWPDTSIARSKIIKNVEKNIESENSMNNNRFGSFTIVNPELFRPTGSQKLPLGNELFPSLVQNIFELERHLCNQTLSIVGDEINDDFPKNTTGGTRNPSTHCAVNFNASFTPHVDSGTGLGQSLSMIVGLGDYKGGEIFVEGSAYPIRYKPLEFDGWKLRHWTGAYIGERFSLVWFTPEDKSRK